MKVKVLKTFRDKDTGSVLRPGLIICLGNERVEELTSTLSPFVGIIEGNLIQEEVEDVKIEVEEQKVEIELPDFNKMKKEEIVKFAKDMLEIELDISTTKAEMIKLLKERVMLC